MTLAGRNEESFNPEAAWLGNDAELLLLMLLVFGNRWFIGRIKLLSAPAFGAGGIGIALNGGCILMEIYWHDIFTHFEMKIFYWTEHERIRWSNTEQVGTVVVKMHQRNILAAGAGLTTISYTTGFIVYK